jgi:S-adenosylmethionine:diacylglycerol 3-amino-3-carboxypropyl transferase
MPGFNIHSRYLRARKFDVAGAIGQFSDTEKWMKEQQVEELYDHFDVETYEKARLMVRHFSLRPHFCETDSAQQ